MGQIEGEFGRIGDGATDQKTLLPAIGGRFFCRHQGPVVEAGTFGTIACAEAIPILLRQPVDPVRDLRLPEALIAPDRKHVAAPVRLDQTTQPMVAAIDAIATHPGAGDLGRKSTLKHGVAKLGLGQKANRRRHTSLGAARPILGPTLRQIERPVDQGMAMTTGIAEKHPDLAVFNPAGRAGILALHADRLGPLLEKARFIKHQNSLVITQMLDRIAPQIIANQIGVPARPRQKLLHPVRRPIARRFGKLPAVLPFQRRHQTAKIGNHTPTRLRPQKMMPKPGAKVIQIACPTLNFQTICHRLPPSRQPYHTIPTVVLNKDGWK